MRPQLTNALKMIWLVACLAVIGWVINEYSRETDAMLRGERLLLAGYVLALLNLPLSIVWWLLIGAVAYAFSLMDIEIGDSAIFGAVVWLGLIVVGYAQWFMLLPWLWRKRKTRRAVGTPASN